MQENVGAGEVRCQPIRELGLLTAKPILYIFNVDEAVLTDDKQKAALSELVAPAMAVFLDAKVESELIDLDPTDASELLASMGQSESGLDQLARIGFDTLAPADVFDRWTERGARVDNWQGLESSAVPPVSIHTDFEKGFIKAEVVGYADLLECGSVAEARAKGKARIEGKDCCHERW